MLADRIRMSVFQSTKKDDPLGSVGNQDLIMGDSMAGYFGTVNGLITNTELTNLMNMTNGILLDDVDTDITFHKFIHKGRILLIPSRPIKHSISWDNIQAQNGVKGKVVTINGQEYLCRLMTGSRHYFTNKPSIAGGEWENLFVRFHVNNGGVLTNSDIYVSGNGERTWCQEVHSIGLLYRVSRGGKNSVDSIDGPGQAVATTIVGWRPVLEVL